MPENETFLDSLINVEAHDGEGVDINGFEAEYQLTACVIPPINYNVGIPDVKFVGISHKEPHLLQVKLMETQDVHTQLVLVDVAKDIEPPTNLVESDLANLTDAVKNIDVHLYLFVRVTQIQVDGVFNRGNDNDILILIHLEIRWLPRQWIFVLVELSYLLSLKVYHDDLILLGEDQLVSSLSWLDPKMELQTRLIENGHLPDDNTLVLLVGVTLSRVLLSFENPNLVQLLLLHNQVFSRKHC